MLYLLIIIFAIVVPLILKKFFKRKIHILEFIAYIFIMLGIIFTAYKLNIFSQLKDTEILNGLVTKKAVEKETCVYDDSFSRCRNSYSCNSYRCNPHSCSCDSKGRNCSTCYSTCYHKCFTYPWEKFYIVYHTLGEFEIDRIDKQGKNEPKRFTSVEIRDPVAIQHKYQNYILGAKYSLYSKDLLKNEEYKIPNYPLEIYDYQYLDRVLLFGSNIPKLDYKKFNYKYSKFLGDLGKKKQLNSVLVLTDKTQEFSKVLEAKWAGGKKNDVIIVIGTNKEAKILWVYSFGWSKNNRVFVDLREELIKYGKVDLEIVEIIKKTCDSFFTRKKMEEFEYLKSEVRVNFGILQIIGFIILSLLLGYYLVVNETYESDTFNEIFSKIGEYIKAFFTILFEILKIFLRIK